MNLQDDKKKVYKTATIALIVLILGMIGSIVVLRDYVQRSIHNERTLFLEAQTETTRTLINELIAQKVDYARICRRVIETQDPGGRSLDEYMSDLQSELYMQDTRLILIDSNTVWHGTDGAQGRISKPQYYGNNLSAELIYITIGSDVSSESIVVRERLQNPVIIGSGSSAVRIDYCAVVYYAEGLQKQISVAFPYEGNSFILDENGLMLYKNFELDRLVDGTNVFSKYLKVDFKYGETGQQQLDRLKAGDTTVGEFTIPDGDYFICSSPLDYNNWYVSFVVPSSTLAAGSYLGGMFLFVGLICVLFSVGIITAILLMINNHESSKLLKVQKEANAYLEKAAVAKGEFLSNMSHDIRTPINGIIGMTMIAEKEKNPPKTEECLRKIDISSKYLLSLVNDVLDMSAIESGKFTITPKPMEIKELLNECMTIIHGQIHGRDLQVISDFDRLIHGSVKADELRLRQVFINILGNAVKFTPEGGKIWFRAVEEDSADDRVWLRFEIQDTGCGMSEEFLKTIWDRFSQEGESARTKYKGTGLGMAITKRLVELMGGEIRVESRLGEGSTFTIQISFERCEPVQKAEKEAGKQSIDGVRILLAEDNDINREIAVELLTDSGAVVDEAVDGRQALEKFRNSPEGTYDLILMDIMMPEMNGKEATVAIRALARKDAATVPIVAMTANVMEADVKAGMECGMNAYLTKPINLEKLLNTIAEQVRKKG